MRQGSAHSGRAPQPASAQCASPNKAESVLTSTLAAEEVRRRDYLPFGESANSLGGRPDLTPDTLAAGLRRSFTTYERDAETGLDYADARYYAQHQGRFLNVDPLPASAKPSTPQSWNRYTYCINNPLRFTDPTGMVWVTKYVKGKGVQYEEPVWFAKPPGGWNPWRWGAIHQAFDRSANQVRWQVLNPWESQSQIVNSAAEAQAVFAAYKQQAVIDFIAGVVEASSLTVELTNGVSLAGANQQAETFQAGRNAGTILSSVAAATTGGGAANWLANRVAGRFGKAAAGLIKAVCCFEAGTPIHTAQGKVPIEQIKVGEQVLSYNEQTGQLEYKAVAQTFVSVKANLVKFRVAGEKRSFTTTTEHPFYVRPGHRARDGLATGDEADAKDWVTASELRVGDQVLRPDGKWTRITSIWQERTPITVYNFEVEGNHSYFVGDIGVLSHNCAASDIAARVVRGFKNLQCAECAETLLSAFNKAGIQGTIRELRSSADVIVSAGQNTGEAISINGRHFGVQVGDMIYDLLHPNGIPLKEWANAYESRGVLQVVPR